MVAFSLSSARAKQLRGWARLLRAVFALAFESFDPFKLLDVGGFVLGVREASSISTLFCNEMYNGVFNTC